jgi:hypothetical protein
VRNSSLIPRARLAALLAAALVLHLAVLFGMATQLPDAQAGTVAPSHAAHAPLSGRSSAPELPYFDLTPPEVRSLGGPTLLEVLEAPPTIAVPRPVLLIDESWSLGESGEPDEHLAIVRFGRAPPVR